MGLEIERKFLVNGDFSDGIEGKELFLQGYISSQPGRTVRVRIAGDKGFLTIKGPSDEKGISRYEFEREVPVKDAEELFNLCEPGTIEKERYRVINGTHTWEVDVFHGLNEGLILAEIELFSEDEFFDLPPWLGKEVTGDRRFYNSMLAKNPYTSWERPCD